tara:strand:+ start:51 stop:929 length:879 start_codon:yes stop_codon:yes gene_type:complete
MNNFLGLIRPYISLMKLRIIVLLLITAMGSLFVVSKGVPDWTITIAVLIGGGLTAAGANSINQYLDRDIDAKMPRTKKRPIPSNLISGTNTLVFGIFITLIGFVLLLTLANLSSALCAFIGSLFYIFVYTIWLKRRSTQNIVIGGAAGAVPPLVASLAVTNAITMNAWLMFLLIFLWTPPHFWALALIIKDDYKRANIPMLPVVKGEEFTRWNILGYSIILILFNSVVMWFLGDDIGVIYIVVSLIFSFIFTFLAIVLLRSPSLLLARRLYKYSILYLAALFVTFIVDVLII